MPTMVELEAEVGLAEAVFDNEAEWPNELVFNRGDILHVLDQRPAGGLADGWWLCADKQGRQGIAPANRLKMIHTFGQDQEKVITPRRFGDVFLYNHRLFDDGSDTFFRQPPLGSLLNSVYDAPTALRNLFLLHGSDHPFFVADKIGNNGSASYDLLKNGGDVVDASDRRPPVVRNVPIRVEGRGAPDGVSKSSEHAAVKSLATISSPNRSRSPPPPPPQRRHFNLSGPLLLSSLVAAPTSSSTSSSGSDEERILFSSGGSGQASPSGVSNGKDEARSKAERAIEELSLSLAGSNVHEPQISIYDKPSSLLNAISSVAEPSRSPVGSSALESNASNGQQRHRVDLVEKTGVISIEEAQRRNPNSNVGAMMLAELEPLTVTYDIPRSLRQGFGDALNTSSMREDLPVENPRNAVSVASLAGPKGTNTSVAESRDVEVSIHGAPYNDRNGIFKPFDFPLPKLGSSSSTETDAERLSISSMDSKSSDYQELLSGSTELRLSGPVAMDTLMRLLQNLQTTVNSLAAFETRNWRRREYLDTRIADIRASCRQTVAALKDFYDFSSGAFVNVNRIIAPSNNVERSREVNSANGRLAKHLAHLVRPLGDSLRLLIKLQQAMDVSGWIVTKFVREGAGNDSLDQFLAVAKQVPQDARQVASFIHGNISSIFPASLLSPLNASSSSVRISPANGSMTNGGSSTSQQSVSPSSSQQQESQPQQQPHSRTVRFADSVRVSTGEITPINGSGLSDSTNGKKSNGVLNGLADSNNVGHDDVGTLDAVSDAQEDTLDDYDYVGEQVVPAKTDSSLSVNGANGSILLAEDKQILQFYSPQVEGHIACLSNAIDDFLLAVEQNQPPKIFVGHSKFVILGAHKLVYIGDSVAQCIQRRELGEKVKQCADHLCETLKYCVTATKQAALQYPSVPCVQTMVDSMVNVSHAAYELKLLIQEAANL